MWMQLPELEVGTHALFFVPIRIQQIRISGSEPIRGPHTHTAAKCQVHQCDQWKCSVSLDSFLVTFVDALLRWSTMNSPRHRRFMTLRYKPPYSQIASRTLLKLLFVTLVNFRRGEVGVRGWTGKRWFITSITWQLRYFRWVIVLIYNMFWLTALSTRLQQATTMHFLKYVHIISNVCNCFKSLDLFLLDTRYSVSILRVCMEGSGVVTTDTWLNEVTNHLIVIYWSDNATCGC